MRKKSLPSYFIEESRKLRFKRQIRELRILFSLRKIINTCLLFILKSFDIFEMHDPIQSSLKVKSKDKSKTYMVLSVLVLCSMIFEIVICTRMENPEVRTWGRTLEGTR